MGVIHGHPDVGAGVGAGPSGSLATLPEPFPNLEVGTCLNGDSSEPGHCSGMGLASSTTAERTLTTEQKGEANYYDSPCVLANS